MTDESVYKDVYLDNSSLKELLLESVELCIRLKVAYDPEKIRVTTDFGTNVIIYYEENDNEI